MNPEKYGQFYWCAKTDVSDDGELYVHADRVTVDGGMLVFWRLKDDGSEHVNLALAPGTWSAVFAASCLDGSAVAVEHWGGEVTT